MSPASAKRIARGFSIPLLLIVGWHIASRQGASWAYAFVPLGDVWSAFLELLETGELFLHLGASIGTALSGLLFGSLAGFLFGTFTALVRPADALFSPLFHALRQVPTLGLIPLIALWFGMGTFSIHLLVAIATFEVMALNTHEGLRAVERRHVELGAALVLTRWQHFRLILMPSAFPSILTGLMQAIAFSWLATVGAELLFTVGPGLGVIMERAQLAQRMDQVIVCLIFIGAMGFAMNALAAAIGRRALRWRTA